MERKKKWKWHEGRILLKVCHGGSLEDYCSVPFRSYADAQSADAACQLHLEFRDERHR
jgi:hypothetical protein